MKKVFLISVFLMLAVSYGYSQTYYYKCVAKIGENGEKSKPESFNKGAYITFTNNKSSCYVSDKNGYKVKNDDASYVFKGTKNGTHIYQHYATHPGTGYSWSWDIFYYFSSDFDKMQYVNNFHQKTKYEYVRTNGEDDFDDVPTF